MESVLHTLHETGLHNPITIVLGCREDVVQVFLVVEGHALPVTMGIVAQWIE